jgi:hypothetical protein
MRKLMTAAMAAITLGGAIAATAAPAEAQPRHYYRYDRGHDRTGAAVAAGVAGLAIGAALAGSNHNRGYYNNGYYGGGGYAYDRGYYAPRVCESNHWVFDPYIGRRVLVRDRYRC